MRPHEVFTLFPPSDKPSDKTREKLAQALLNTTRQQCTTDFAEGETRCAVGVIAEEVYGAEIFRQPNGKCMLRTTDPGFYQLTQEIPYALFAEIQYHNSAGVPFSEIAEFIKDWRK